MRYNWSMWKERNDQDRTRDLMRIALNSSEWIYENIENQVDMAEEFIDRIAKNQQVKKEDIIEGLCKRWNLDFIIIRAWEKEPSVRKKDTTSEKPKPLQSSEIKATDKYKKKDRNTIKEVCRLLSKGKNYSEIAREMHIDRRTVKKIAVNYGFAHK